MVSGGTVLSALSSFESNMNSYKSQISSLSSWKGASHDNLVSKAEEFASSYTSAIQGQMNSFASACDLYNEYEEVKKSLSVAKNSYSNATEEYKNQYAGQVSTLQSKLDSLKTQIEGLLSSASSPSLEAASMTGSVQSSTSSLGTPSYGSLTEHTYKAPNGLTFNYYLYIPNYGQAEGTSVTGLPVMLYMHGGGNNNGYGVVLQRGLAKELNEKNINPSGIVIIPHIKNFSDSRNTEALKSLVDDVVSTYKADSNRISVSGHSNGAITTYKLINQYPNYFAAAIPISGFQQVTDAFKYTKVWAFNGEYDNGKYTSNSGASKAVQQINSIGGVAKLYTYKGYGHSYVQDFTYEREFESPDGDTVAPIEWAMRQTKSA